MKVTMSANISLSQEERLKVVGKALGLLTESSIVLGLDDGKIRVDAQLRILCPFLGEIQESTITHIDIDESDEGQFGRRIVTRYQTIKVDLMMSKMTD